MTSSRYIRVHTAAMEMRRALRKRESGKVVVDGCIIRWDTNKRCVSIESCDNLTCVDDDVLDAVHNVAHHAQYTID
jgi:hypothetical protein